MLKFQNEASKAYVADSRDAEKDLFDPSLLPQMDWLNFRFRDPAIEKAFHHDSQHHNRWYFLVGIFCGALIWSMFGLLDVILAVSPPTGIVVTRYGVVLPILIVCFIVAWRFRAGLADQVLITVMMQSAGIGLLAMMVMQPDLGRHYDVKGLITVMVYGCFVLRPRPHWAAGNCAGLVVGYLAVMHWFNEVGSGQPLVEVVFLIVHSIIAVLACTLIESLVRDRYARDVALVRRLERERTARGAAERANNLKSRFLTLATHELRTPLNAIIGFSEMIGEQAHGPIPHRQYVDYAWSIHDSGSKLNSLLEDLLEISQAEAGTLEARHERVAPDDILRPVIASLEDSAGDKGLSVTYRPGIDGAVVWGDPHLLRRAFEHLLSNALKFTQDGDITVETTRSLTGHISIVIADTGQGIPEHHQSDIFEIFIQGDDPYSRRVGGAGLGLALVKRILDLHGGRIAVSSNPSAGTTVTISLPAAP